MKELFNRLFRGWKRNRIPLHVWEVFRERGDTDAHGRTMQESLATMPADQIVEVMADHYGSDPLYLLNLYDDLNQNRGEVDLM